MNPQSTKSKVLIIDDEPSLRQLIRLEFEGKGYEVIEAMNGNDGLHQALIGHPSVVLLDLGLPDLDGTEVLKRLREWSKVPVVVLTVRDLESEKVALLDAGADDYLTKPFGMAELAARVKVALRHSQPDHTMPEFKNWRLEIDFTKRRVHVDSHPAKLTATEYELLRILVQAQGRVITSQQLLREIWGPIGLENPHYVRVYIGQLRKKIEADPSNPRMILTEPGIGYRFNPDA